ncbi:GNAT family N-acetyltransferase [Aquimarina sp. D1M17]|uniref:GNAT family N-acetyltransferase n=1 Tax=Aquimarina acroporae TaxID=2937283 RepID=UPI0020BEE461|nr:GNAT family protein [Aquimarina acroporae]MCK8523335.1 GNAT family N-acetyltransferase [Aquimarina acroporae]
MKAVNLETERLSLRRLSLEEHLSETYVAWLNDVDVYQYLETGGNYTLDQLETYLKEQEEKDILFWGIHIKDSDKHIGNIKIDPIDSVKNSGEYGIMMGDKNEWGKGYAKEASICVINYCFEAIKLSQITLGVIEKNIGALKLYENMGFEIEGIIENKGVYAGELCNSIRMIKKNDE